MKTTNNLFARSEQALSYLDKVTVGTSIAVVFIMMAVVVYGVALRYIFNAPVSWVAEISEFMMVALTFLVLAYLQYQRQHVRISFFVTRQSERTQMVLGVITTLCALTVFVLVTWASWEYALKALHFGFKTDETGFPLFPPRLLVTVGCFLICLRLLADLVHGIKRGISPQSRQ